NSSILVWDVTGRLRSGRLEPARVSGPDLERLWAHLAGPAAGAYEALWTLVAVPEQAVPWLRERLRLTAPADPERLRRLPPDLESGRFAERDRASKELEAMADLAEPALRQIIAEQPSIELRL